MASHVPIKSHLVFDGRMVSQEARQLGWSLAGGRSRKGLGAPERAISVEALSRRPPYVRVARPHTVVLRPKERPRGSSRFKTLPPSTPLAVAASGRRCV
jgi:hypothetical protein